MLNGKNNLGEHLERDFGGQIWIAQVATFHEAIVLGQTERKLRIHIQRDNQ